MQDYLHQFAASAAAWGSDITSSQKAKLTATALLSGTLVAGSILGYQASQRNRSVAQLKRSIATSLRESISGEVLLVPDPQYSLPLTDPVKPSVNGAPPDVETRYTRRTATVPDADAQTQAGSKEDQRSAALATRARQGDYNDGRQDTIRYSRHRELT